MEEKQICNDSVVYDRLPPLSSKYPWFVAESHPYGDQIICTIHESLTHYRCQIPALLGSRIRACFHDWVILSTHPKKLKNPSLWEVTWSLWNPISSRLICLPPLMHEAGDTHECCLSSHPGDPSSVFLLTTPQKRSIVYCQLDCKRKKIKWIEMSYANQLDGKTCLKFPTCCNGKVYALSCDLVIHIDVMVSDKVVISLFPIVKVPRRLLSIRPSSEAVVVVNCFLKGSLTELFYIEIITACQEGKIYEVHLYKLDINSMIWEEMKDLKDAIFFIELGNLKKWMETELVFYRPAIASDLGGYIHIHGMGKKTIQSYNIKDKTMNLTSMPSRVQTSHESVWAMLECRLKGGHTDSKLQEEVDRDNEKAIRLVKDNEAESYNTADDQSQLLGLPFDILKLIMEFCVGVEYINFRATCKRCHLIASPVQCCNKTTIRRLRTYSLVSAWFMVLDNHRGIITFKDPMSGDKYFIKTPQELIDFQIYCSMYGWLLMFKVGGSLVFYNPFTSDIRKLPQVPRLGNYCFSAPPTSPDCMVVGFETTCKLQVYIHLIGREPSWRRLRLNFGDDFPYSFCFPILRGRDLYALLSGRVLCVIKDFGEDRSLHKLVPGTPKTCYESSAQYFQVKCDQHLLLVIVGDWGGHVEVFKLNDSTEVWEKLDDLGKHMIYICETGCLCVEAKTPEMENKIFFPQLHSKNGNIVFYSLETCTYYTFSGENIQEISMDFLGTKHHHHPHAWIEPSWS